MRRLRFSTLCHVLMLLTIAACRLVYAETEGADGPVPEVVKITAKGLGAFGSEIDMVTQVFKPDGGGPFPVLVFAHGRPGEAVERGKIKNPIPLGHARYWLKKGYAVVAPIRPGYGETGGPDRENAGARYDADGRCTSNADHANTAYSARNALLPVIEWVRNQPWAKPNRILLEGQSVGGLATVALCAASPPGVVGCINFSGGSGGSPRSQGRVCDPEVVNTLMLEWGKTTRLPNIWLYAANDLYWGADVPKEWHQSFASGGSASTFIGTGAVPDADGHLLLRKGGKLWSIPLNAWLTKNGFARPDPTDATGMPPDSHQK